MKDLGAVITAMVTPFKENGEVNYEMAGKLAKRLLSNGSDGVLVAGTTGESPTLSSEEKLELFSTVREAIGSRGTMIAGVGTNDTKKTVEFAKLAQDKGPDALLVVSPYYNKPPQEALYRHFRHVAESVSLPVIIYNIPGRTGVNILPETLGRLMEIPNIKAVKDCTCDLGQVSEFAILAREKNRARDDDFVIYSGEDGLVLPILSVGGHGVISVVSHVAGPKMQRMIQAYREGNIEEAKEIHLSMRPLVQALFETTNPILAKAAMNLMGFDVGGLRLPLIPAADEQVKKLESVMIQQGILRTQNA
ncbi:MAG: 4-hydroxy-tetrahydrodipicolinate synthase [Chloroflexi bacterium]|nr:4-hydroxy-tetrahydrodipicolinate synthase [Chloroflexota bacterium]